MNRYEQYLLDTKVSTIPTMRHRISGNPVYTRDQAIALAAELPGLVSTVQHRIDWIKSFVYHHRLFESTPGGLNAVFARNVEHI